jgi:NADH-quinone oxidoreductase subunit E
MANAPTGQEAPDRTTAPAEETFGLGPLNQILEEFQGQKGAVIPILQRTQDAYGYLPAEIMEEIAKRTGLPLSRLYGVATFYAQFRMTRRGRHLVRICDGTACHVRGAAKNVEEVEKALGVAAGETSPDYKYTMEIVYCLGSCGLSPTAIIDDKVYGRLTANALIGHMQALS